MEFCAFLQDIRPHERTELGFHRLGHVGDVIAGLIFVIIRLLFRRALWDMPKTKMIVDFVLALIFLLVCAVFVVPLVRHLIETTEIPDDDYNMVVNADGTPYEFHDPF